MDNHQFSANVNSIMKLTDLCMAANVFQYDNKLFRQIKGLPMGSPVSVVLSELTMQYIEKSILTQK